MCIFTHMFGFVLLLFFLFAYYYLASGHTDDHRVVSQTEQIALHDDFLFKPNLLICLHVVEINNNILNRTMEFAFISIMTEKMSLSHSQKGEIAKGLNFRIARRIPFKVMHK